MWAAYFGIDPMQAAAMAPGMASESVRFAAAAGLNFDAQNRQKELDAKIVSEAAAADKKRRAQTLANSRKGTIKTSPLGLPGGGFAQKQLLGA
jgi:hypothetical protein